MNSLTSYTFVKYQHLLIHLVIGIVVSRFQITAQLYLIATVFYFIYQIIRERDKTFWVLSGASYFAGAEVFLRMTGAMPFWETGKYMTIFFMLLGMFYEGFKLKAWPILLFLILMIPGVIVTYLNFDYFDESFRKTILFNLSGPLSLCATALYCYKRDLKFSKLLKIVDYMILPIFAMLIYIILYSPSVQEIVFTTESNVAASAGFSGNQVATVLGLGMFLTFFRLLIPHKNLILNIINIGLLGLFSYRCLLTFSRGGLITAVLMILVFSFLYFSWVSVQEKARATIKLIGLGVGAFLLWGIVMAVTEGLIFNRYTGKNVQGEDKDITTGRGEIISEELSAFLEEPFFGVGVGMGKFYRYELDGEIIASHNEVARMLAEHGLLGILALVILFLVPLGFLFSKSRNLLMLPFVAFWFLTINHSAMRVALPGFMYGFALLNINYASKKQKKPKTKTTPLSRQPTLIKRENTYFN